MKQYVSLNEVSTSPPDRAAMPDPVFALRSLAEGGEERFPLFLGFSFEGVGVCGHGLWGKSWESEKLKGGVLEGW